MAEKGGFPPAAQPPIRPAFGAHVSPARGLPSRWALLPRRSNPLIHEKRLCPEWNRVFSGGEGGIPAGGPAAYQAGLRRPRVTGTWASVALCAPPLAFESFYYTKETRLPKESLVSLAERVGFEPTVPCGITGFQDQLLKPLGHLSISREKYYIFSRFFCQE